jgi:hypothetical protein
MKCGSLRVPRWAAGIVGAFLILGATSPAETGLEFSVAGPTVVVSKDKNQVNRPAQVGDPLHWLFVKQNWRKLVTYRRLRAESLQFAITCAANPGT